MADDEQPTGMERAMKYDLLLTGGDVLDPAGGLRGLMDIGIAGGKISAVAPSLPVADARRTISAKGWLVTPGLVDIHAHIFVSASDMAGHTDHFCRASGVTTLCDAGSTGSATFSRAASNHRPRGAHPDPRLRKSIGDRHRRHLARWRAIPFPLCRPRGLRTHDQRKSRPRDRRQAALRAGAGLGIQSGAGQIGAQDGGYGWRRADDDAHHRLADPIAGAARPHEAGRHRHPLLSRARTRHHGPGKTADP